MEIIVDELQTLIHNTVFVFIILLISSCAKSDYNPNLVKYLRAEKDLRKRIPEEQGLNDSIKILQQKYRIDSEKELSKLKDDPEGWLKLIKELKIEK